MQARCQIHNATDSGGYPHIFKHSKVSKIYSSLCTPLITESVKTVLSNCLFVIAVHFVDCALVLLCSTVGTCRTKHTELDLLQCTNCILTDFEENAGFGLN